MSLIAINQLPAPQRRQACARMVPRRCWQHLARLTPALAGGPDNPATFRVIAPKHSPELHLRAPADRWDGDYAFSLDLDDAGAGQLELSFIVINDLTGQRFNIDRDQAGNVTLLGTASRNRAEEQRALEAGLGPCQVRPGLRMFSQVLPLLEQAARDMGYVAITLRPLTYHNAVMYENYGFGYITGHRRMKRINDAFRPDGELMPFMDASTPFRNPRLAHTARGRSWAIHDGILTHLDGEDHLDLVMVKSLDHPAHHHTFHIDPSVYRSTHI